MADKFKCPVAVFFFPMPPTITPVQNSFRTLPAEDFEQIPRTVKAFLRKGQAMQLNLSELNDGKNPAGSLITRDLPASIDESLEALALRVRDFLGITLQEQMAQRSVEDAVEHNQGDRIAAPGQDYVQMMLKICTSLRENTKKLLHANLKSWQQGYGGRPNERPI